MTWTMFRISAMADGGRMRIQRDARAAADLADLTEDAVQMLAGFHVHRDDIGATIGETFQEALRFHDHQMDV